MYQFLHLDIEAVQNDLLCAGLHAVPVSPCVKRLRVLQSHVLECKDMKQYLCLDVDAEVDETDQVVEELFEGVNGDDEDQLQHNQSSHLPSTPNAILNAHILF